MAEIPNKTRRRVLDFADEVTALAERAPDATTRRELLAVSQSIRKRFGFSKEDKQLEIWKWLHEGASTINDLLTLTKFHRDDVYAITKAFELAKFVEFRSISVTGNGRPSIMIFPIIEKDSFSPLKLN
jgi:hypothetical protein